MTLEYVCGQSTGIDGSHFCIIVCLVWEELTKQETPPVRVSYLWLSKALTNERRRCKCDVVISLWQRSRPVTDTQLDLPFCRHVFSSTKCLVLSKFTDFSSWPIPQEPSTGSDVRFALNNHYLNQLNQFPDAHTFDWYEGDAIVISLMAQMANWCYFVIWYMYQPAYDPQIGFLFPEVSYYII